MAADLVVLSGCRTGDAVVWGGDEAFGLLPALREAGDAAVLVSLWAVEDGAADAWMQRFHGALAAGTPAAAAWQVAVAESRSEMLGNRLYQILSPVKHEKTVAKP